MEGNFLIGLLSLFWHIGIETFYNACYRGERWKIILGFYSTKINKNNISEGIRYVCLNNETDILNKIELCTDMIINGGGRVSNLCIQSILGTEGMTTEEKIDLINALVNLGQVDKLDQGTLRIIIEKNITMVPEFCTMFQSRIITEVIVGHRDRAQCVTEGGTAPRASGPHKRTSGDLLSRLILLNDSVITMLIKQRIETTEDMFYNMGYECDLNMIKKIYDIYMSEANASTVEGTVGDTSEASEVRSAPSGVPLRAPSPATDMHFVHAPSGVPLRAPSPATDRQWTVDDKRQFFVDIIEGVFTSPKSKAWRRRKILDLLYAKDKDMTVDVIQEHIGYIYDKKGDDIELLYDALGACNYAVQISVQKNIIPAVMRRNYEIVKFSCMVWKGQMTAEEIRAIISYMLENDTEIIKFLYMSMESQYLIVGNHMVYNKNICAINLLRWLMYIGGTMYCRNELEKAVLRHCAKLFQFDGPSPLVLVSMAPVPSVPVPTQVPTPDTPPLLKDIIEWEKKRV